MISIRIDNLNIFIKSNVSILEACKYVGINVPKFCYHESLSIAGNCRMCLVELQKIPKPVASCAMPVSNNMTVFTSTPLVKKARENVLETLLINHPLDCPICDQGGECDLQEETKTFGITITRFFLQKRSLEDKNFGLTIKTIMTRCIHCTRCVRFSSEITGLDFFGIINRGANTEISNYVPKFFNSFLSGNVIDLCPVGALTSKNYAFKARPWELKTIESIDLTDGSGSSIYFNYKESEILRIIPKINKDINDNWISDRTRFCFDSFKNSRLHSLFKRENSNFYIKTNWNFVIKELKIKILKKFKSVFLVNNEIDFKSLLFLKKIIYYSKNQFLVLNVETNNSTNIYINWLTNKINDIKRTKNCFLFFVNIYTENIVINTKLKTKYKQEKFNIFNFGNIFKNSFPINFSNISIKNLLNFFESKIKFISKLLIKLASSLIFIGESLYNKISKTKNLILFLKNLIKNVVIITVNIRCNTEGLKLLNISSTSTNFLNKSDFFISINLIDNLFIRKYFNKNKNNFWLNSHGSLITSKNKYILPVLSNFEEKNIFLNLEQRPQQTTVLFTKIKEIKSTKFFLKYILKEVANSLNYKKKIDKYNNTMFIYEILNNLYLFKKIKIKFSLFFSKNLGISKEIMLFSKHYVKSNVEDFFLINSFCKNSLVLNDFSINYRGLNKNFFF